MTSPANALDPLSLLAVNVHARPGAYALLLGSGVSTGAGIPTAWGVVQQLVRKIAVAGDTDPDAAAGDPDTWWASNGQAEPLTYSGLLERAATTPAARKTLLEEHFIPTGDDRDQGRKVPGPAHKAIAELVASGYVKVILTTNFDRLIEHALDAVGISPTVISRPEDLVGAEPLQHAAVTVIKLHGDYTELDTRNTVAELEEYPPEWNRLLDRVFDEYGLIVAGWSAASDIALVSALRRTTSRRYPLYWDSRSSKSEDAQRLLTHLRGQSVPAGSADELFGQLLRRLEALEKLSEPPLTTALSVTLLKRYLPDPVRNIDLHDLVMGRAADVSERLDKQPYNISGLSHADLERVTNELMAATLPLLHLVTAGVYYDRPRDHVPLWEECLQRLLTAAAPPEGQFQQHLFNLKRYPALLLLRAAGVLAVHLDRDDVLLRLLAGPSWRQPFGNRDQVSALEALDEYRIFDHAALNEFPRWGTTNWHYPTSVMLREDLRGLLRSFIVDDDDYAAANDGYEFRVALAVWLLSASKYKQVCPGIFIGEQHWSSGNPSMPHAEEAFRAVAAAAPSDWPWWPLVNPSGPDGLDAPLTELREELRRMRRF